MIFLIAKIPKNKKLLRNFRLEFDPKIKKLFVSILKKKLLIKKKLYLHVENYG